jgi:prepilin-type N-terminal cleavage/methylation domain-containing protein
MFKMFAEHKSISLDTISAPHTRPLSPMGRGESIPLCFTSQAGFSLMEVLVGVMILGIVYATLFGLMSGSLKNVSRIEEREKMVRYGEMKLNELVIRARQGELKQALSGRFDDKYSWQAQLEAYDTGEETSKNSPYIVARIRLFILWSGTSRSNRYDLETLTWVPKPKQTV